MRLSIKSIALLIAVMAFGSCKTNSTANPNNISGSPSGASYLPLVDNTIWAAHVTGSSIDLDVNGNVTQSNQVDRDYQAVCGFVETHNGRSVHPIYAYDTDGTKTNGGSPIGYAGTLDSEVFAMNQFTSDIATIFPSVLNVGQSWTPAPTALPIQCQAKLVQQLAQFTNKGGTSYNDVIQVFVTYLDSSFNQYNSPAMSKISANADLYFANGLGLVEADIHNYDGLSYNEYNGTFYDYQHSTASGTVYRKN